MLRQPTTGSPTTGIGCRSRMDRSCHDAHAGSRYKSNFAAAATEHRTSNEQRCYTKRRATGIPHDHAENPVLINAQHPNESGDPIATRSLTHRVTSGAPTSAARLYRGQLTTVIRSLQPASADKRLAVVLLRPLSCTLSWLARAQNQVAPATSCPVGRSIRYQLPHTTNNFVHRDFCLLPQRISRSCPPRFVLWHQQ